jgi:hypothetical protein
MSKEKGALNAETFNLRFNTLKGYVKGKMMLS